MGERSDVEPGYGVDHKGSRRLGPKESAFWYGVATVSYLSVATFEKGLLTWIIGPAWLVGVVVAGPALVDRWKARR